MPPPRRRRVLRRRLPTCAFGTAPGSQTDDWDSDFPLAEFAINHIASTPSLGDESTANRRHSRKGAPPAARRDDAQ